MAYKFKGYVKSIECENNKNNKNNIIKFNYTAIKDFNEKTYLAKSDSDDSFYGLTGNERFICDDKFLNLLLASASSNNEYVITFEVNYSDKTDAGAKVDDSHKDKTHTIIKVELNYE